MKFTRKEIQQEEIEINLGDYLLLDDDNLYVVIKFPYDEYTFHLLQLTSKGGSKHEIGTIAGYVQDNEIIIYNKRKENTKIIEKYEKQQIGIKTTTSSRQCVQKDNSVTYFIENEYGVGSIFHYVNKDIAMVIYNPENQAEYLVKLIGSPKECFIADNRTLEDEDFLLDLTFLNVLLKKGHDTLCDIQNIICDIAPMESIEYYEL